MQQEQRSNNCYSRGELSWMRWGQRVRQKLLKPMLRLLVECDVSAQHITLLSLIVGLLGAAAFYDDPFWGLIGIALHVLFDGMDGPLARVAGTQSNRGSFYDTATDQTVLVAVTFVLIDLGWIDAVIGGVFALLYTVVVGFAMIRNYIGIPYRFLIRPRFFYYAWIGLEWAYGGAVVPVNTLLLVFNILLAVHVATGFINIRNHLR
jgi:phosphatidylglycerophosphate synthase